MNVDRYITEEMIRQAEQPPLGLGPEGVAGAIKAFEAYLPGILARHRADVLRDLQQCMSLALGLCHGLLTVHREVRMDSDEDRRLHTEVVATFEGQLALLTRLADEAVAE